MILLYKAATTPKAALNPPPANAAKRFAGGQYGGRGVVRAVIEGKKPKKKMFLEKIVE